MNNLIRNTIGALLTLIIVAIIAIAMHESIGAGFFLIGVAVAFHELGTRYKI